MKALRKEIVFAVFQKRLRIFQKTADLFGTLSYAHLNCCAKSGKSNARIAVRFLFSENFILRRNVSPPFVLEFFCAYIVRVKRRIRMRSWVSTKEIRGIGIDLCRPLARHPEVRFGALRRRFAKHMCLSQTYTFLPFPNALRLKNNGALPFVS